MYFGELRFIWRVCLVWARLGFTNLKGPQQPQIMETNNCKCHFVFWNNKGILIWTRRNLANTAVSITSSYSRDSGGGNLAYLPSFTISFDIPPRERGSVRNVHYYSEGVCVTDCASLQPLWIHITPDNPSIQKLNKYSAAAEDTFRLMYFNASCHTLQYNNVYRLLEDDKYHGSWTH